MSYVQLAGFRLHPGPLPEQYRFSMQVPTKKKQKKKKNKVNLALSIINTVYARSLSLSLPSDEYEFDIVLYIYRNTARGEMRHLRTKKRVEEAQVLELEGQVMTMTKKRDERKSIKGTTGNGMKEENKRRRKRKRDR